MSGFVPDVIDPATGSPLFAEPTGSRRIPFEALAGETAAVFAASLKRYFFAHPKLETRILSDRARDMIVVEWRWR